MMTIVELAGAHRLDGARYEIMGPPPPTWTTVRPVDDGWRFVDRPADRDLFVRSHQNFDGMWIYEYRRSR